MHGRSRSRIEPLEKRVLLASAINDVIPIRDMGGDAIATIPWQGRQADVFAGQWILKLDGYSGYLPDQQRRAINNVRRVDNAFKVERHLGGDGVFLVTADPQLHPNEVTARLGKVPGFRYVTPDFLNTLDTTFPNDSFFGSQWGLHNIGQSGGVSDADVDAPEAWDLNRGSDDVVIGIIDTGVDYNHPDLAPNIWINPAEIPGNGVDDDANGYIDDIRGWDFVFNTNNPIDQQGHGTHVAGIAGARGNNGQGISGVNWNVKLLPLKCAGGGGGLPQSAIIAAHFYVNHLKSRPTNTVNIVATNNSYGGPFPDPTVDFIINEQNNNNIMVVAAAGNNNLNNDVNPHYPSSYAHPNVIAVANLTRFNTRAFDSNYGPTSVDLAAPGDEIASTWPGGQYVFLGGTSMASPHVAGAVALIAAAVPQQTVSQIKSLILQTVDAVPGFNGLTLTGGRLNVGAALAQVAVPAQPGVPDLSSSSDTGISSSDNITRDDTPTFQGFGTFGQTIRLFADGVQVAQVNVPPTNIYTITSSALADGDYDFTVTAANSNGQSPHSAPLPVTIDTVAPAPSGLFRYHNSPHEYRVEFGENVTHSVSNDDFGVIDLGTTTPVSHSSSHDGATHTTAVSFPGNAVLPDARYRLTVFASGTGGGISDVAGNTLAADAQLDFLFLTGDANNDGRVNLDDFNILAANFGQSGRDYSQGDLDYSGNVNLNDFNILAAQFGQVIAPEPGTTGTASGARGVGTGPNRGLDGSSDSDELEDLLA